MATTQQQARRAPACKGSSRSCSFYFLLRQKTCTAWEIDGKNGSGREILSPASQTPAQGHIQQAFAAYVV